jgi:lipoprotein-releasing system permease protein
MNLSFLFAKRYLFGKKSTNAINIISGLAVLGLAIGTAAMILLLSVFNGFEHMISNMSSSFNPDIKITAKSGKFFHCDSILLKKMQTLDGVFAVAQTLEETSFFEYKGAQDFGILKGVDENYKVVTDFSNIIQEGTYKVGGENQYFAILGSGMRNKLAVNLDDQLTSISVFMPKKEDDGPLQQQYARRYMNPIAVFSAQQEIDYQYIISNIDLVRELLEVKDEVSSLEIKCTYGKSPVEVANKTRMVLGDGFLVKDRYEQDAAIHQITNIEKWITFAILSFMMILISFNLIGALWMMVIEKKRDIATLKAIGASDQLVRNIFLSDGLLMGIVSCLMGTIIALILYYLQKNYCLFKLEGMLVECYPAEIRIFDIFAVCSIVLTICLLAAILPARRAMQQSTIVK